MTRDKVSSVFYATVVFVLWLTPTIEGRNGWSAGFRAMALQEKEDRKLNVTMETTACLNLANCHLARGDIFRSRNGSYETHYKEARFFINKYLKWVDCGVDRINEKCRLKELICWMAAKQEAINQEDDLSFVNGCNGETLPYSYNLCIGDKPGHWPADIAKDMNKYYPTHCSMVCSLAREFDEYHRKKNVTKFPQDWDDAVKLGVEDQDTRAMGRDIVSLFIMTGRIENRQGGVVRPLMKPRIGPHDIATYAGPFYCLTESRCRNQTKCERKGPDCLTRDQSKSPFPCDICSFNSELLTNNCNYCVRHMTCQLYSRCTGCSTTTDTCDNCAIGSVCQRKDGDKEFVEEDCRTCTGCTGTSCQDCLGCFYHRELVKNSPEAICLFYSNCTDSEVPVPKVTDKTRGIKEDEKNCRAMTGPDEVVLDCLRGLIPVPWVTATGVVFISGRMTDKNPKPTTIIWEFSTCRYNSWVSNIYDSLPNFVVGVCLYENLAPGLNVMDNLIGYQRMEPLDPRKMVTCGRGPGGHPSYIRGATVTFGEENGAEFIQAARWHCSGKDLDLSKFGVGRTETVMCPQETLVCSFKTYLKRPYNASNPIKEPFKISNLGFGCCDVPTTMYYSSIDFRVQLADRDSLDYSKADDDRRNKRPRILTADEQLKDPTILRVPMLVWNPDRGENNLIRLCDPDFFISYVGMQSWISADGKFHEDYNSNFLALDFKCTDYLNNTKPAKSISTGLYSSLPPFPSIRVGNEKGMTDCGKGRYAFGIVGTVVTAHIPKTKFGTTAKYVHLRSIDLWCSNNRRDDPAKSSFNFTSKAEANDYPRKPSEFRCPKRFALCGFIVTPTDLYITSGYHYQFICCPIPVRRIMTTQCEKTGVIYDIERDFAREDMCKGKLCTDAGSVSGKISEWTALPAKLPTSHYAQHGHDVRKAILHSSNVSYTSNFSKFFDRNNFTAYGNLKPFVLEHRSTETDTLDGIATVASISAGFSALAPPLAAGLIAVASIAAIASTILKILKPDPVGLSGDVAKFAQQLNAIQETLEQSRLFAQVQELDVDLTLNFSALGDNDRQASSPRIFRMTAECGINKYNVFGPNIHYNIPSHECAANLTYRYVRLNNSPLLNNLGGGTAKNFTVRFNSVGLRPTLRDNMGSLSHYLKWEDMIADLSSNISYGQGVADHTGKIVVFWDEQRELFRRPNRIKFYFADIQVPPNKVAAVYQDIVVCDTWELYTKQVQYRLSNITNENNFDSLRNEMVIPVVRE